ncbi:HD domain-containing protein [Morganella morganii]|uniref:HD domain-containing protein n=1 Tax=Morganella morganii TaxID=582 RepID=UPI00053643FC|nr:HD domain-containing protein [Morganella morganii]AUU01994.1 HD domain-containing protein [Morganella morganii]AVD59351.1 HD domain-containing protein [Morganella morganii]EHZ6676475.1 HD domain-containing protein [Morganella morganii]EKU8059437.1 HD domain-containing protein [Morganella morganii]EKW8499716.1 HD domain-containing protein [Morganella morganii]
MSSAVPAQEVIPFSQLITFVMELDKLKSVYRKTRLLNNERQENSAEHSWHFAMTAMTFAPYVEDADMLRILKMALLHDVVEIDAGDVLVFDLAAREAIAEKEVAAAKRIFGLLPQPQADEFQALWNEYDAAETREARIANMIDRVMPVLMNLHNNGQSWVENNISLEQVIDRTKFIADVHPAFWTWLRAELDTAKQKGWLR